MKTYLYILVMAATTYLIRVLPLTLIRKPIRSVFLRSFLFYVPYVTLSVMTFPAIMNATQSPIAGAAAMVIGIIAAWCGLGLLPVSLICCASVIALEFFIVPTIVSAKQCVITVPLSGNISTRYEPIFAMRS